MLGLFYNRNVRLGPVLRCSKLNCYPRRRHSSRTQQHPLCYSTLTHRAGQWGVTPRPAIQEEDPHGNAPNTEGGAVQTHHSSHCRPTPGASTGPAGRVPALAGRTAQGGRAALQLSGISRTRRHGGRAGAMPGGHAARSPPRPSLPTPVTHAGGSAHGLAGGRREQLAALPAE